MNTACGPACSLQCVLIVSATGIDEMISAYLKHCPQACQNVGQCHEEDPQDPLLLGLCVSCLFSRGTAVLKEMVVVEGSEHWALVEGQNGDAGDAEQDAREFHFAMEPSQLQSLHPVITATGSIQVSSVGKVKHCLFYLFMIVLYILYYYATRILLFFCLVLFTLFAVIC